MPRAPAWRPVLLALLMGASRLATVDPSSTYSVRCLDPRTGEALEASSVTGGEPCHAEITGPGGVVYQFLARGESIDWDAVDFGQASIVVTPDRGRLVAGQPLLLGVTLSAPDGLPPGARLAIAAPWGVLVDGQDREIPLPALGPGETARLDLPVASLDPTLTGRVGIVMHVESAGGTPLTPPAATQVQVDPDRLFSLGTLDGVAWLDHDGDGVLDSDEPGVEGLLLRTPGGTEVRTGRDGGFFADGLETGPRVFEVVAGVPGGWTPAPGRTVQDVLVLGGGAAWLAVPLVPDEGRPFRPRQGLGAVGSLTLGASGLDRSGVFRYAQEFSGMRFEVAYGDAARDWSGKDLRRNQPAEISRWLYALDAPGGVRHGGGAAGLTWSVTGDLGALRHGAVRQRRGGLAAHDVGFRGTEGTFALGGTEVRGAVAEEVVQQASDAFSDTGGFQFSLRDVERVPGSIEVHAQRRRPDGSVAGSWRLTPHRDYTLADDGSTVRLSYPLDILVEDLGGAAAPDEEPWLLATYGWVRPADEAATWGGSVRHTAGNGLTVGATTLEEGREDGAYRLEGQEIAYAFGAVSVGHERARSQTEDSGEYESLDGGRTWVHRTAGGDTGWREATRSTVAADAGAFGSWSFTRDRLEAGYRARGFAPDRDTTVDTLNVSGSWLGWSATGSHREEERAGQEERTHTVLEASRALAGGALSVTHDREDRPGRRESLLRARWEGQVAGGLTLAASQSAYLRHSRHGSPHETDLSLRGRLAGGSWRVRHLAGGNRHLTETAVKGDLLGLVVDFSLQREVRDGRTTHRLVARRGETRVGSLAVDVEDHLVEEEGRLDVTRNLAVRWRPNELNSVDARVRLRERSDRDDGLAGADLSGNHSVGSWDASWRASRERDRLDRDRLLEQVEASVSRPLGEAASLRLTGERRREENAGSTSRRTGSVAAALSWRARRDLSLSASALRLRDESWLGTGDHDVLSLSASWRPGRFAVTGRVGERDADLGSVRQRTRLASLAVGTQWDRWSILGEVRRLDGDVEEAGQRVEVGYRVARDLRVVLGASFGGADDAILAPDGQDGVYLRLSGAL